MTLRFSNAVKRSWDMFTASWAGEPQTLTLEQITESRGWVRDRLDLHKVLARREVAEFEGLRLEYYLSPKPSNWTILALPGLGLYSELSAHFYEAMSQQGYNVLAVDPPGHGFSAGDRGDYDVDAFVGQLSRVIDVYAKAKPDARWCALGYSIGAPIALTLAESDSRIDASVGVTLLMPELAPSLWHRAGWQWLTQVATLAPNARMSLDQLLGASRLPASPQSRALADDPMIVRAYPTRTLDSLYSQKHATLTGPMDFRSLIVHGEQDAVLPLSYSERIQKEATHFFDLRSMAGDHFIGWSKPVELAETIADWLGE